MRSAESISASKLKRGDYVAWLGQLRKVKKVRRSLGNGWTVTFDTGLTANMSIALRVQAPASEIAAANNFIH